MAETTFNISRADDAVAAAASLQVEVIADLVCPFCFIGKRRFDSALNAVQGPSDVSWYPFQLNPDVPESGLPFDVYLTQRFGNPANVDPIFRHLEFEGLTAGIEFRFDRIRHVPNTLPVHQLMQLAETLGKDQSALADDLLSAFFEQGLNIGETSILENIAAPHGIEALDVRRAVDSQRIRQLVQAREVQVRKSGLVGVPGFLINRSLLVVGAQESAIIVNAFDRAMFGQGTAKMDSPALH
jgi:predicted DsbA family dithiol-disulfide isomerase